jgi:hypothetical protein
MLDNDGVKARPVTPNKGLSNERGQVRILRQVNNLTNQDAKAWTQTVQQMSQLTYPDSPDLRPLSWLDVLVNLFCGCRV